MVKGVARMARPRKNKNNDTGANGYGRLYSILCPKSTIGATASSG